ncbi:MAG: hypothetical protein PHH45_00885 [Patescibacteria group bacterium]|nr:hypothetical protein [Patescibacteria group bacterium]
MFYEKTKFKNFIKNIVIFSSIITTIFVSSGYQVMAYDFSPDVEDQVGDPANVGQDPGIESDNIGIHGNNDPNIVGGTDFDWNFEHQDPLSDLPQIAPIEQFFDNNYSDNSDKNFLWAAENIARNPKLILNPSDEQDIRILYCLGSVIPDYANNPDSLAVATGNALEYILDLQADQPEKYQELVEKAQEGARLQIVSRLKHDVANFACIAGVDQVMAAEMLQYQEEEVDAIIEYAKEKIVIDRRVLQLLVNLVTPKDQGGAGHERIKVYRIRRGYDRDAKMYSRESQAIYEAMSQQREEEALETVGDVATADRPELAADPEFSNAEALATVTDTAGRSQGDLIFSDEEDEANISAHFKGQAIDISEVDNIKCTLIKKKRIGSSKKIKQPPTPIKLAWQTNEGYDASPPPDWSSLNSNLRDIASSQYIDMLDEFGIDADYDGDLSNANFSDIVGLIGNSLIGEILNSPGNSLSGYSLSDTAKKIGALVLADMFDLPREALLDSELLNLSDMEEKIGEAIFEEKANLPYGSIRGENFEQILINVGKRHLEKELGVPEGTIQPGMDPRTMQLTIGRRVIDEELYLQQNTFQSDSTYNKLKDVAGPRKIEMIFATPSMVDERLGIEFGISEQYKGGSKSPDNYAILVGAKRLQDSAYLYGTSGATGNALSLARNLQTGDPDTATASTRFTDIMSGNSSNDTYKTLGIEYLAQSLSNSSQIRTALMQWLQTNSLSSQNDCAVKAQTVITIPKPGSTTGETLDVTIPEDQIMTSFGLRRGDIYRLFGCYNVQPKTVFRALGERALWDAVRNSTIAQQAEARFLAEHPEISNFLRTLDFYLTRVSAIKETINKIDSDWSSVNDSEPTIREIRELISGPGGLKEKIDQVDSSSLSLANLSSEVRKLREVPAIAGRIYELIREAQLSDNRTILDRVNTTLVDVSMIIHNIDEIITGEEQPMIETLQIGDINYGGSNGTGNGSGIGINRATLIMMLSGRLSPKDFLVSVGSNRVEDALGLPTNSILYFAKYLLNPNHDKEDIKGAFFRSVGQAQVEETFNMPPFFFQADYPGKKGSLTDIKNNVARSFNISEAEAGARIMRALNLPGSFSTIESGRISGLNQIITAAAKADEKLRIKTGTTADFLNGEPLNKETLSNTENRIIAGRLELPEAVVDRFERVKNGEEDLSEAKENQFLDISYNNHNEYANKPNENSSAAQLANQCPIHFRFEQHDGFNFSISPYIEDNSYIYTDADGAHSFSSIEAAREYQETATNQGKKVDFVKAIANSLAQNPDGSIDAGKSSDNVNKIESFLQDKNVAEAFPDTNLVVMHDQYDIPLDTLKTMMSRKEIKDLQIYDKPYGAFLEYVGQKTAERKVVSTLLGDFSITLAGERIDATDIFDLLNGNGMQVAYRIGARYLERQFDISSNLISRILESPTEILRQCSLAEIGGNLLGSVLGLRNVSLDGNIYENIGGAKIEESLNLPPRSFRGTNLDQLITNVGAINFARAFYFPIGETIDSVTIDNLVGPERAAEIAEMPMEDQYVAIEEAMEYPDAFTEQTLADARLAMNEAEDQVMEYASTLSASGQETFEGGSTTTISGYQRQRFVSRMTEIDGMLNLSQGTTRRLLTGQIAPDDYRREVSEKILSRLLIDNATGWLLEQFGLGDEYKRYLEAREIYNMIKSCDSLTSSTCNRAAIFNSFEQLFGINLDAKLGLDDGTIARIIQNPERAASEMIYSALVRLDRSLGLADDQGRPYNDASFSYAYQAIYGNNGSNYQNCEADSAGCLRTNTNESIVVGSGFTIHGTNRWSYYAENIGDQLVGNYLNEIGLLRAPPGRPNTAALIRSDAAMLLSGDLRVLGVTAAIRAAEELHIYGEGQRDPNLPAAFRITYEDIRYAVLGNPVYEDAIVQEARDNFLTEYQRGNTELPAYLLPVTEESEMSGAIGDTQYGALCAPGVSADGSCVPEGEVDSTGPGSFHYSADENLGTMTAAFGEQYPSDQQAALEAAMRLTNDQDGQDQLRRVEEAARNEARRQLRNNLMYRMGDAKLYQVDKNIPPGFTKTMFEGSGRQRTMMIVAYVENVLRNLEIGGVSLGNIEDMVDIVNMARQFIADPSTFDLDSLVADGRMARLDSWLSEKFGDFFGFDLQPGTFTALFYGIKTGDFSFSDFEVAGPNGTVTIQSIRTIYTNWAIEKVTGFADKALGLPQGTTFQAYTMYRNLSAARTAVSTATNAITNGEMALETAVHAGDAAAKAAAEAQIATGESKLAEAKANVTALKAELITFVITMVFSKQTAAVESALGLVPGTGAILIGIGVSMLMGAAINPFAVAMFVLLNLFGVYKVELKCTADGYYPSLEDPPDPTKYDNPGLGVFNGLNNNVKKEKFVEAAQYKARTLAGDALMLSEQIGDELAIPSQIMVGRQEDVDYWNYKIDEVICSKIGGCAGTRAGMWKNPQTTFYTHIGF